MELKQFVTEAITQVMEGVKNAQHEIKNNTGTIAPGVNPYGEKQQWLAKGDKQFVHTIIFDVAVTVVEESQSKAGVGWIIGVLGIGASGQSSKGISNVSRIQFEVPIIYPTGDS